MQGSPASANYQASMSHSPSGWACFLFQFLCGVTCDTICVTIRLFSLYEANQQLLLFTINAIMQYVL